MSELIAMNMCCEKARGIGAAICPDCAASFPAPECQHCDNPTMKGKTMLNANDLTTMAQLLDEAAGHLRAFMETELAEKRQLRHFLPDELEGSAIMLRDATGVALPANG